MVSERRSLQAVQLFDLVDQYLKGLRVRGSRPRPFGDISFWVTGEIVKRKLHPFPKPWKLLTTITPSGYYLYFGKIEFPDGTVRKGYVSSGEYLIQVQTEFYQIAERPIMFPREETGPVIVFDLLPGYLYPFPSSANYAPTLLRSSVKSESDIGVANVKIQTGNLTYRTDDSGQWVLVLSDDHVKEKVTVNFTFPDGKTRTRKISVERGRSNSLPPLVWSGSP